MSHDIEAAWASSEIANLIMKNQNTYFGGMGTKSGWSVYSGRERARQWPLADGVILAENATYRHNIKIALEYKRTNEGLHGVLTALGQSLAYLEKGYDASIIVIPEKYSSHLSPGSHLKRIIDSTTLDLPISLYTYSRPNPAAIKPFSGKIDCVRDIVLPSCRKVVATSARTTSGDISTLWAHVREGMSYPDAFFRYCQAVKLFSSSSAVEDFSFLKIPNELENAVKRIAPGKDIYKYLSNTLRGDSISDKVWRYVWFKFYFWNDLIPIYISKGPYVENKVRMRIKMNETEYATLFSGRSNSIKETLVTQLNAGLISEDAAWEAYARKVKKDSHSYREVIDSGLFHMGFLDSDGNLSDLGYKFVDACERISNANIGIPLEILRAAALENGQYRAFLQYIYLLSESRFSANTYAFCTKDESGKYIFNKDEYLDWINSVFVNQLHIAKTSTLRAGGTRSPFQAELPFLKKLGFIKGDSRNTRYRIGLGLEIDWPQVQNSMLFFQSL